jgi:hypothetical protein
MAGVVRLKKGKQKNLGHPKSKGGGKSQLEVGFMS